VDRGVDEQVVTRTARRDRPLTCGDVIHRLCVGDSRQTGGVVQPSRRAPSAQPTLPLAGPEGEQIEVRRSARRRRTVSAYREDGRVIVLIPASFSGAEERRWVAAMVERLRAQETRRTPAQHELGRRSAELSRRYLGGAARPVSVRWVDNQRGRWGSCTPLDGTIRISSRVRGMPGFVLDYVLLH
jgi:predicted metal-dependent hydrolase